MTNEVNYREKQRILEFAQEKFFQNGFYKISMDVVASELGISKKTIYKYFSSKDELVEQVVKKFTASISEKIDKVIQSNEDSLSKAFRLFEIMGSVAMKFSDKWVKDIQIHMPMTWKKIDDFRTRRAYAVLGNIIKQGQQEGMIIDKPSELIIHLFVSSIKSIVNPDFLYYQKFNYKEAFQHTFEILFSGILTEKGKKKFGKIFKKAML